MLLLNVFKVVEYYKIRTVHLSRVYVFMTCFKLSANGQDWSQNIENHRISGMCCNIVVIVVFVLHICYIYLKG